MTILVEPCVADHRCEHFQVGGALNVVCAVCGPLRATQAEQRRYVWAKGKGGA